MKKNKRWIWKNGKFLSWNDAHIHVLSHSLHYGGAAFEGIRFYKTKNGSAIFRLSDHLARLKYSASVIGIEIPYSSKELTEAIRTLIRKNKLKAGYIRPIVYYGQKKLKVVPTNQPVEVAIAVWKMGKYLETDSVKASISTITRLHPTSGDMRAKVSGTYFNAMLAGLEARRKGSDEAVLLDIHGSVAEGSGENIFMVKDGKLLTPKEGNILEGITRDTVFEIAKKLKIPSRKARLTPKDLRGADEAFFCGTAAEITPIAEIDGHPMGSLMLKRKTNQKKSDEKHPVSKSTLSNSSGTPMQNSITASIALMYSRIVTGKEVLDPKWLTEV